MRIIRIVATAAILSGSLAVSSIVGSAGAATQFTSDHAAPQSSTLIERGGRGGNGGGHHGEGPGHP